MRAVYLIPNLLTSANLFCGVLAICLVVGGEQPSDLIMAGWLIFLAMVLDLFDGVVARLFKATSEFGVQFDSLSDFLSFGVAPALLAYRSFFPDSGPLGRVGIGLTFLYITFVALRLARFNTMADPDEKSDFSGLPCPLAAGLLVSGTICLLDLGWIGAARVIVPIMQFLLCILMVSNVTYPSLGTLHGQRKKPGIYMLGGIISFFALVLFKEWALFLGFGYYISYNLFRNLWGKNQPSSLPDTGK